jgi:transcriptional regulator with XRE-family HTH domain
MSYAERIKKLREKLILSQKELAGLLGYSYVTICRWETGKFAPTIKMKTKLSNYAKLME